MSNSLINACNALDALSSAIRDGWAGDQTLNEAWGWNCPPLNRHDLSDLVKRLADRLRERSQEQVDQDLDEKLTLIPQRLSLFQNNSLPYLYNGNASGAFPNLMAVLDWVNGIISPYLLPEVDWQDIDEQKLMPRALLRRLRSVDTQIRNLEGKSGDLDKKVQVIDEAHAAAESLPTDLASLEEARADISEAGKSAQKNRAAVEAAADAASKHLTAIKNFESEARKLIENCEDAYSAATTKGLGESFSKRATALSRSMWVWVGGLLIALIIGAYIGYGRVALLHNLLLSREVNIGLIWINLSLSLISVAAPVWFAWVATKQIGQRFRLSEDYAFKASVAQAYEGYRREAARLDPQFAARLFGSALERIEEAPLRFVETETHGSPWHEIFRRSPLIGKFREPASSTRRQTRDPVPEDDIPINE